LFGPIFEQLGITLDIKELERSVMYQNCMDANTASGMCLGSGWFKDYPDGTTFGAPLFGSVALWESCCNYALLVATSEQLSGWRYEDVTSVPSVDAEIDACDALPPGDERFQCWADLDKKLMEEVVPWIPYLFDNNVDIISENVINYSFDQNAGLAAFDQLAVADKS
jgi:ABC-type oligopeptide transport system substrate-binding subunit